MAWAVTREHVSSTSETTEWKRGHILLVAINHLIINFVSETTSEQEVTKSHLSQNMSAPLHDTVSNGTIDTEKEEGRSEIRSKGLHMCVGLWCRVVFKNEVIVLFLYSENYPEEVARRL